MGLPKTFYEYAIYLIVLGTLLILASFGVVIFEQFALGQKALIIGFILMGSGSILLYLMAPSQEPDQPKWWQKPLIKFFALTFSLFVPVGLFEMGLIYVAATNSNRLQEINVYRALIFQATILVGFYSLLWGTWILPKLQSLFKSQTQNKKKSPRKQ